MVDSVRLTEVGEVLGVSSQVQLQVVSHPVMWINPASGHPTSIYLTLTRPVLIWQSKAVWGQGGGVVMEVWNSLTNQLPSRHPSSPLSCGRCWRKTGSFIYVVFFLSGPQVWWVPALLSLRVSGPPTEEVSQADRVRLDLPGVWHIFIQGEQVSLVFTTTLHSSLNHMWHNRRC